MRAATMGETSSTRSLRALIIQMLRYYAVAAVVAVGYLGTFALILATGLHYFLCILITQVITVAWAFPLYRRFVFHSHGPWGPDFLRFLSVWAGGAIAGFVLTPLLVEFVGVAPFWAQLVTLVVVSLSSFLLHRVFTFRAHREAGR